MERKEYLVWENFQNQIRYLTLAQIQILKCKMSAQIKKYNNNNNCNNKKVLKKVQKITKLVD